MTRPEALAALRDLAGLPLDVRGIGRLLERIASHDEAEALRDALVELGARAFLDAEAGTLTERERLAIHEAARGCVSGTLAEWPVLASAFAKSGLEVPDTIGVPAMRGIARFLVGRA